MTMCCARVILVLTAILFLATSCERHPKERIHVLPNNFYGWVVIRQSVAGAPSLGVSDEVVMIDVPENGYLETSSSLYKEWGVDLFQYSDGTRIPSAVENGAHENAVRGRGFLSVLNNRPVEISYFFVGSQQDFNSDRHGWRRSIPETVSLP